MTATSVPRLRTPGVIAEELGVPLSRILYLLRTRPIAPAARAGTLRLYDLAAVDMIRNALTDTQGKGAGHE